MAPASPGAATVIGCFLARAVRRGAAGDSLAQGMSWRRLNADVEAFELVRSPVRGD